MTRTARLVLTAALAVTAAASGKRGPEGPYLGQASPGASPKVFAPGIVSTDLQEAVIAFSPDGGECWWSVTFSGLETILTSRRTDGRWTAPAVAPFSGRYYDGWPAMQPDGRRLFFHSSRPTGDPAQSSSFNLWVMDRTMGGWSEPRPVGTPVNGKETAVCPSVTRDGTIYLSKRFPDGTEKLCRSRFLDGKYSDLEVLPPVINAMKQNFHGAISPDERYLVRPLYGRADAIGAGWNYYVSFRTPDDGWSELVNLGKEVNGLACGGSSSFSPDGKYLFFQASAPAGEALDLERRHSLDDLRRRELTIPGNDIYWVETSVLEEVRKAAAEPKPAAEPAPVPDPKADDLETIRKNIRASIAWALTKDRPLLESVIAHDDRLFMFNPSGPNTVGWSDMEKLFPIWMDSRFKATACDIRDLKVDLSRSGDVAWWSCRLDDLGEWDGKPTGWKDVRWTGVLEKRDGAWVIVQMHFSYPAERFAPAKAAEKK